MAFGFWGFPARFTESRTYNLAEDELFSAVKSAFENLGWLAYVRRDNEFSKFLNNNPFTWGEELAVKVLSGGVIEAESKSYQGKTGSFMMILDFGANKSNIKKIFAQIEIEIKERSRKMTK
ncbi:MAG: hypothetical protein ACR2HG_11175 [Pyrinomonadaceae bacterium]